MGGGCVDLRECVVFLWLVRSGESFHAYTRFIRWDVSTVYWKHFYLLLGEDLYREGRVCI